MTVESARAQYDATVRALRDEKIKHRHGLTCTICDWIELLIEAASLTYDLAVSEESRQRIRDSVAW